MVMELPQRDRLSELVEQLTTSGEPQLNQDRMKEIKKICKYGTNLRYIFTHRDNPGINYRVYHLVLGVSKFTGGFIY